MFNVANEVVIHIVVVVVVFVAEYVVEIETFFVGVTGVGVVLSFALSDMRLL